MPIIRLHKRIFSCLLARARERKGFCWRRAEATAAADSPLFFPSWRRWVGHTLGHCRGGLSRRRLRASNNTADKRYDKAENAELTPRRDFRASLPGGRSHPLPQLSNCRPARTTDAWCERPTRCPPTRARRRGWRAPISPCIQRLAAASRIPGLPELQSRSAVAPVTPEDAQFHHARPDPPLGKAADLSFAPLRARARPKRVRAGTSGLRDRLSISLSPGARTRTRALSLSLSTYNLWMSPPLFSNVGQAAAGPMAAAAFGGEAKKCLKNIWEIQSGVERLELEDLYEEGP